MSCFGCIFLYVKSPNVRLNYLFFFVLIFSLFTSVIFTQETQQFCEKVSSKETKNFENNYKCNYDMPEARERTFIMVKPDGVQRGLVGEIIKRFEQKGFKLVAMKFMFPTKQLLEQHYADLSSKPFFPGLIEYMATGPVVPMVWEGLNVIKTGRLMLGATDPKDSAPGTIRGDLCIQVGRNIIHGSDSIEASNKEISLWFKPDELVDWKAEQEKWIYEN